MRVLVTRPLPAGGTDPLLAAGIKVVQSSGPMAPAELTIAVRDVDGVVCLLNDCIDDELLAAGAPRLRVVSNVAVGHDNVDLAAASRRGVAICNTPGILDETTADLAFLLLLGASRLARDAETDLREGRWRGWDSSQYLGRDVNGAVLGIVGYGRIGRALARRAAGFDMTVLHHTRQDTGVSGWCADLDELLERAEVVSLHVPLSEATRHLITAERLDRIGSEGVLVNTARGPVVDELDLAIALEQGRLFAAGIDVYEREPEVHPRLLAAPRTMLLPHIGSATSATRRRMAQMASEGVVAVLNGRMPFNVVR